MLFKPGFSPYGSILLEIAEEELVIIEMIDSIGKEIIAVIRRNGDCTA